MKDEVGGVGSIQKRIEIRSQRRRSRLVQLWAPFAQYYCAMGRAYHRMQLLDSALVALDEACRLDPFYPEARYVRGMLHFDKGNYASAVGDYAKAARLDPANPEAHVRLYGWNWQDAWKNIRSHKTLPHRSSSSICPQTLLR